MHVIDLGTNDYSFLSYDTGTAVASRAVLDQTAFVQAYTSFVTYIRQNNPSALIVLCSSPMLTDTYPTAADAQHTTHLGALRTVAQTLPSQNRDLAVVAPDATSLEIAALMARTGVPVVAVVDRRRALLGAVTLDTLLDRLLAQ